jgi:uncharacterized UPF0160 family protein
MQQANGNTKTLLSRNTHFVWWVVMKRFKPTLQKIESLIELTHISSSLTPGVPCIVTHSGHFHCDEVLACCMLKTLPEFQAMPICRTRNEDLITQAHIVLDVGATYDPANRRFDHHQRSFSDTLSSQYKTKLSSAGLVYKHFGKQVLRGLCPSLSDDKDVDVIYKRVYEKFVEHIDGIDNGIEAFEGPGMNKKYSFSSTLLSSRVGTFNPEWNETNVDEMARFKQAMQLVFLEFSSFVTSMVDSWLPARLVVQRAINERFETHTSGKVIKLELACPWKDHLVDIEQELNIAGQLLYALYPEGGGVNPVWRIQAVPLDGFTSRLALAEGLRGLRDDALSTAAGVDGCVFVHASGFVGGAKSLNAVIKLAEISMA